jgi:hypothetical protein
MKKTIRQMIWQAAANMKRARKGGYRPAVAAVSSPAGTGSKLNIDLRGLSSPSILIEAEKHPPQGAVKADSRSRKDHRWR